MFEAFDGKTPVLMLKSCRLPKDMPPVVSLAEHLYMDMFDGEKWQRLEIFDAETGANLTMIEADSALKEKRWERRVWLHGMLKEEAATTAIQRIEQDWQDYPKRLPQHYRAWPGPNSNTFMHWAMRLISMKAQISHNNVGKDFTLGITLRKAPSGKGFSLDTLPLGLCLSPREGIELHFLGMTIGVGLSPFHLKLPLIPAIGRRPGLEWRDLRIQSSSDSNAETSDV